MLQEVALSGISLTIGAATFFLWKTLTNTDFIIESSSRETESCFVFKYFIYLFMRDTEREAETQAGEKQAPHKGPDVGLVPEPWDHALS